MWYYGYSRPGCLWIILRTAVLVWIIVWLCRSDPDAGLKWGLTVALLVVVFTASSIAKKKYDKKKPQQKRTGRRQTRAYSDRDELDDLLDVVTIMEDDDDY